MFDRSRNERVVYFDIIEVKIDQRSRIERDIVWTVETWGSVELAEIKYKPFI